MTELFPFFLFVVSSTFTPGPNNYLILNSGLNFGVKRSLPHFFGIMVGFPFMIMLVALGFGVILEKYTWLQHVFKIAGSAYMLYLAWQILRSTGSNTNTAAARKPMTFMQAVLFQWVNPKAWIIAIGVISVFTITNNYVTNAIAIGSFFALIGFFTVGVWLVFGAVLKRFLTDPKHLKLFNRIMAASLVASIALIFIEY